MPRADRALRAISRALGRLALRTWPFALVTLLGLWLLWPVPSGQMPLAADHTVHLTRAWLYGQQLAGGHLVGWSPFWGLGFPLGELYPPLGDIIVLAVRGASLGLLGWPQAYALAFTLVFLLQGWVLLRCGRALGLGPLPGLVAAALALLDVGAYREGGWVYTVTYGVWPQALATSLAWLALAELALAARVREDIYADATAVPKAISPRAPVPSPGASEPLLAEEVPEGLSPATSPRADDLASADDMPSRARDLASAEDVPKDISSRAAATSSRAHRRHLALAALAAAGAILAHPISLPMLALAAPLWLVTVGLRGPTRAVAAATPWRPRLADAALDLGLVLGLGLALAAWWLWPMSAHRGYMAAYGWLYAPLDSMLRMLQAGQWTQLMAPLAGHAALLGLVFAALRGAGFLRFVALLAVLHWLLASTDVFWTLRLDHLSAGFSHIQYQRFLTAAKPGLYLLAGAVVGGLFCMAQKTWSKQHVRRAISVTLGLGALTLAGLLARDAWTLGRRHGLGVVQVERAPQNPALAAAYDQFLAWAEGVREGHEPDYRIAVRADRNAHWFMDSPVFTGTPIYKIGFTPGDNFVHKPESGDPRVLDIAQARYLLTHGGGKGRDDLVASFGPLRVYARPGAAGLAHVEGPGEVVTERADLRGGHVQLRVTGASLDASLVFHIAGYPRWDLSFTPDGGPTEPVPWVEVPIVGEGYTATPAQRLAGELRGGKAHGDDGSEPTLIAAPARDGVFELRYARWRWFDLAGLLASLAAAVAVVRVYMSPRPVDRLRPLARRLAAPPVLAALAALALVLAGVRWRQAAARERTQASAWLARGDVAAASHARTGPLKTDMLIFPAILADRRRPTEVIFKINNIYHVDDLGAALGGWIALDDDDAKARRRGTYRLEVRVRPSGTDTWTVLAEFPIPHRPGRQSLAPRVPVPSDISLLRGGGEGGVVDLALTLTPSGEAPPRLGFDLPLGAP